MQRPTGRLARAVGLTMVVGLVLALAGCSQPAYRFVGSADRDSVLRVPRGWTPIDTKEAQKAQGLDPATQPGWSAYYDAAAKPAIAHLQSPTEAPTLIAQTIPLTKAEGDGVTPDALLAFLLPQYPMETLQQAMTNHILTILKNEPIAKTGESGLHLQYSIKNDQALMIYDREVLVDAKHHGLHTAFVTCTQSCYTAHQDEISDVIHSLTLKST